MYAAYSSFTQLYFVAVVNSKQTPVKSNGADWQVGKLGWTGAVVRWGTIMYSSTVVNLTRNRPIDLSKCTEIKHYLLCRFVA